MFFAKRGGVGWLQTTFWGGNMYCKRILILQQTNARFAEHGKQLCGMVKLVNSANQTKVTVFVTNVNHQIDGEWWLLLNFGGRCVSHKLQKLSGDSFSLQHFSLEEVACLLVKKQQSLCEVARAHLGNDNLCATLVGYMHTLSEQTLTEYEQFVSATNNFYPDVSVDVGSLKKSAQSRYKVVEEYSDAFEHFYASGGASNYYQTVKGEIVKVFVQFPPYYPLINKYKESFFVRVDFPSSDKYFVMGVLQKQGEIRYICYGLPAEKDGIADKDFIFVQGNPTSFYMLFQDANTGQITTMTGV